MLENVTYLFQFTHIGQWRSIVYKEGSISFSFFFSIESWRISYIVSPGKKEEEENLKIWKKKIGKILQPTFRSVLAKYSNRYWVKSRVIHSSQPSKGSLDLDDFFQVKLLLLFYSFNSVVGPWWSFA